MIFKILLMLKHSLQKGTFYLFHPLLLLQSNPAVDLSVLQPKSLISSSKTDLEMYESLMKNSDNFFSHIPSPTKNNLIKNIIQNDQSKKIVVAQQAKNSYPILHAKTKNLLEQFLKYKKQFGSPSEKNLYATMNSIDLITRLLEKRPLMFMTGSDAYLLRDGKTSGSGKFETIGTSKERAPLLLQDYLSYDEMQLAALIGVSSPTLFINNGDRSNVARKDSTNTHLASGVYVGLVGARFERPNLMEWQ